MQSKIEVTAGLGTEKDASWQNWGWARALKSRKDSGERFWEEDSHWPRSRVGVTCCAFGGWEPNLVAPISQGHLGVKAAGGGWGWKWQSSGFKLRVGFDSTGSREPVSVAEQGVWGESSRTEG